MGGAQDDGGSNAAYARARQRPPATASLSWQYLFMATDADAASQDAAKLFKEGFYSEAICAYDAALNLADAPTQIISILCNRSAALLKAGKFGEAAEDAR